MVALATNVAQAHEEHECQNPYIYEVDDALLGKHLLWMSNTHVGHNDPDGLSVSAGDGLSVSAGNDKVFNVSIEKHNSNTFYYVDRVIMIEDDDDEVDIYKVYYTTSMKGASLEVCFYDQVGFWYPSCPVDGRRSASGLATVAPHTNSPPQPTDPTFGTTRPGDRRWQRPGPIEPQHFISQTPTTTL